MRLERDQRDVGRLLDLIDAEATRVTPKHQLAISKHSSDNRFYECAEEAKADYIVTGNLKHFTEPYLNTRIITGRQLLELLVGGKL